MVTCCPLPPLATSAPPTPTLARLVLDTPTSGFSTCRQQWMVKNVIVLRNFPVFKEFSSSSFSALSQAFKCFISQRNMFPPGGAARVRAEVLKLWNSFCLLHKLSIKAPHSGVNSLRPFRHKSHWTIFTRALNEPSRRFHNCR